MTRGASTSGVVLGLSFGSHDAAAALVVDGRLVAAVEEERLSRIKHDRAVPIRSTAACLALAGIGADDIDHVVFYEKPLAVAARFLAAKQRQGPTSFPSYARDAPKVFGENLFVGYRVGRMLQELGARRPPMMRAVEHHLSHAASAFFPSPFEHACVVTIDGVGEWATTTIGQGHHHRLSLLEELRYPDSIGLAYSFVTAYCGFAPNSDEYKVMGLAPYGEPRFVDELTELVAPLRDGSVRVDLRRLGWFTEAGCQKVGRRGGLGGPPRSPDSPVTQREADLAASVQRITETAVLGIARRARELTGERAICLAGGVALNCVSNGRLLRQGLFDDMWIQPAAGDAGGAVGAALAYWHLELGNPRTVSFPDGMSGAFLGPSPDNGEISAVLAASGIEHRVLDEEDLFAVVAERLADGAIVGWCRGAMEFGPRALGHRSILADPRGPDVRRRLNEIVKGREGFRPFAPAVLAEHAAEWFDLDVTSPYMLVVAPVHPDRMLDVGPEPLDLADRAHVARSRIPACTHVDGSARVQTVTADGNPDLHRLLSRFHQSTECPVLVNTSFNRAGEPIVASAADALHTAVAGGLDLLVLGDAVVEGAALEQFARRRAAETGASV